MSEEKDREAYLDRLIAQQLLRIEQVRLHLRELTGPPSAIQFGRQNLIELGRELSALQYAKRQSRVH